MRMPQGTCVVAYWCGPSPRHTDGERRNGWVPPYSTETPLQAKRGWRESTLPGLCTHGPHDPQLMMGFQEQLPENVRLGADE
jgi:hypothetical protein